MGLRGKLGLIFLLVSALAILVLCVAVYTQAQSARLDRTRSFADERLQLAAQSYDQTEIPVFGSKVDDPELPAQLRSAVLEGKRATFKTGSPNSKMWAAVTVKDGKILSIVQDYETTDDSMRALQQALIVGGLGTVGLVALVSVILAGGLSKRIVAVASTARRIAAGDLDASATEAVGKGKDEVSSLAAALDTMASSLRGQLEAERRFTADVAHDLRTPVTGLTTAAELLPPGRPSELVRDRAKVLRRLVEDLLEIARFDSGVEQADLELVGLGAFVGSAVARLRMQQSLAPDSVVVQLNGKDETVSTDSRRIERILANLIVNGLRHGRPPIEVTVTGRIVEVVDHGNGYPEELIAEGPRRFRSGMAERGVGHGLGLTIAAGHAKVLGAELTFGTAPDGGALARLVLPALESDA
ncbi:HAMP domain-containing sensor histidine kinase [Kribbella albertanoniae]|uniref:histidine kinase n=1 Tax=Kribbella albertanoniae TaxID=1266829 RepID=A0A4R4PU13_9ACTN|nr:HAMP domain-containing sensor histidine kinase [Kribbella albertanoniae]TDC25858.1 HAMP domain-containing histidine kinase [Kribbella albertanoniae]